MIPWREKLTAFGIHFMVTAALALAAAAVIFLVWYPSPFHDMVGGTELFLLVVGCDLALGPLISLVIYDSRKSRRQLLADYGVVGAVQLAALVYGVYVVCIARPVHIVFVGDRYEVVAAADLEDADLKAAPDPRYRVRPLWGPDLVATYVPPEERNAVLDSALAGKDVQLLPRYYVPYESQLDKLRERAGALDELARRHAAASPLLDAARAGLHIPEQRLRWLPVRHRTGFWTALIDVDSGRPLRYLPIDPYESAAPLQRHTSGKNAA